MNSNPEATGVFVPLSPLVSGSTGEGFRRVNAAVITDVDQHGTGDDGREPVVDGQYPVPGRSPEYNRRIAGHECGHAWVMRALSDAPISYVSITRRDGFEGRACGATYEESRRNLEDQTGSTVEICARIEKLAPGLGSSRIESAELLVRAQTMVIELVAGSVAERILFPDETPLRAEHDKIEARAVAAIACASPRSVDALLVWAECEAESMISENLSTVEALLAALVDSRNGKLTGIEVDAVIEIAVAREAQRTENERRARWRSTELTAARFVAGLG
jgi:hypothetical protein